jgi:hypothetical protein
MIKILNLKTILKEIILTFILILNIAFILISLSLFIKVIITLNIYK